MQRELRARVLDEAEIASAARALGTALHDDPFVGYVFPDPGERARRLPQQFATLVRFSSLFGAVVVTEDMLGVSTWQPPGFARISKQSTQSAAFASGPTSAIELGD